MCCPEPCSSVGTEALLFGHMALSIALRINSCLEMGSLLDGGLLSGAGDDWRPPCREWREGQECCKEQMLSSEKKCSLQGEDEKFPLLR